MTPPPIPLNESERLAALRSYNILDTLPEPVFDDIAILASEICGTPIALITLVDDNRQWFKARKGLDLTETPRDQAFCAHAILEPGVFLVPDATQDPRFQSNPLVTGQAGIRFYAGAPLVTPEGHALGTLCVIDRRARTLTASQTEALMALSRQVIGQLELHRTAARLKVAAEEQRQTEEALRGTLAQMMSGTESSPPVTPSGSLQWIIMAVLLPLFLTGVAVVAAVRVMADSGTQQGWIPWGIGLAGALVSVLFGAMVWSLSRTRDHAMAIAANQTRFLRTTESRMTSIIASVPEAVLSFDGAGTIRWCNPAAERLFDYPLAGLVGRNLRDVLPDVDLFQLRAQQTSTSTARKSAGDLIPVAVSIGPAGYDSGATDVVVIRDRTEQARLQAELEMARDAALESSRLKAQFLANMSHEIRTPMNGVIGMTGVLLDFPLPADQRDVAETIKTSAESLLTIVNDILDFSRIEAGKLAFESVDFDVRQTVEAALGMVAEAAHSKGLELAADLGDDVPDTVRGDAGRLRQVLANLLSNAVKFTQTGEVVVGVRLEPSAVDVVAVRFWVRDTGVGIPVETQTRLFEPFVQADASTTRHYGGTGLGLAISRQLVELMGGRLMLTSAPDQGSTFFFTAHFKHATTLALPALPLLPEGLRVLIVDDNETNRTILVHQLTRAGLHVTAAANATAALSHLDAVVGTEATFGVGLIDMQMPGIDGLELARRVRKRPVDGTMSLILLTSMVTPDLRARATEMGIAALLTKPLRSQVLLDTIGRAIGITPTAVTPQEPQEMRPLRRGVVLLVEDNAVNRKVARRQLEKLGFAVVAVEGGADGLAAVEREPFDAIMMDCQMPGIDGFTATAEIRRRERERQSSAIPIIAMTASALEGDRDRCLAAGMNDYVSKPVDLAVLETVLERWIHAK